MTTRRSSIKKTSADTRSVGVPITVVEKYDYLKTKNPQLDKLRDIFDLEIEL